MKPLAILCPVADLHNTKGEHLSGVEGEVFHHMGETPLVFLFNKAANPDNQC